MKIIAVDFGEKRVGIASTDESGSFALPRMVLPNDAGLLEKVLEFRNAEGAERVVIGESKAFDGSPNPIAAEAEKFKKLLEEQGIEVVLHPEVLTTREARQIQGNTEMTDASAAALILKSYLDSVSSAGIEPASAP